MSDTTKPAGIDDSNTTVKNLLTSDDTENESDELFSDDDQKKEIKCSSDVARDVSVLSRSETPLSFGDSNLSTINPSDAVVPSTPLSLLPFLNKINEQWTSDLETPQAQPCNAKAAMNTDKIEVTPKCEQFTPDVKSVDRIISESPVIVSRAARKRPKRRRIFRSSTSIDPMAVTNNEDVIVDVKLEATLTSENTTSIMRDDTLNAAASISSADNVPKDCESKVCNRIQETCSSEELEKKNTDYSNTSTQDFFINASFSDVDKICSNSFNKQPTNEIIESERNVEVNENVGFFTARGASINVSTKALSKAKRLFADTFDADEVQAENYEPSAKKNSIEQKDKHLPSPSFVDSASISIAKKVLPKPKLQFTEQLKDSNKMYTTDSRKRFVNKSPVEDAIPILFSTASGAPINISKEALSKAKTLLADGSNENNDDDHNVLIKHCEKSLSTDRNSMKQSSIALPFSTIDNRSISVSKQSLTKPRMIFTEHLDTAVELIISNKVDNSDNDQCNVKASNIGFQTASGKAISISEQALSKAKALFAEQLDNPLESDVTKEIENVHDEKIKKCDGKLASIGFQTARGTSISISEEALSRAKALFADQFGNPSEIDIAENVNRDDEEIKKRNVKVSYDEYRIANYQRITVANKAPLKAQELISNDCVDESTPDNALAAFQKRKLSSDENTPLSRGPVSELKKARLSNEFLARRLSFENVDTDNEERTSTIKLCPDGREQIGCITDFDLGSPERGTEQSTELDTASSPVIGRQPISRKRKSLGRRKDRRSVPADKMMLNDENVSSRGNILPGNAPCKEKADVNESNAETQKERQSNTESSDYGDTQMMMDFIDESAKILRNRLAAALEQEEVITAKRRCGSKRQLTGHLYRCKQTDANARLSLRQIANGAPPTPRSHQELIDQRIPPNILAITAATAASYKFRCSDFYGSDVARGNVRGIGMEDGVRLILDENGYVGVWEFLRAFLASPGVDPNLVPARWVDNHYRWIVWKLASMDRMKFGTVELPRALTPSYVMAQLKYRYDREIDRSQRPAIRRILEKDDVASKRMILCVSSIVENSNVSTEVGKSPRIGAPKWKIELTDGWYGIPACIDAGLARAISMGKIREGAKLVVSGAELLNCDQGCYPLEAPADVCLKLHANSARRARWDTKLGYAPRSGPIPIKLRNVCASGGLIGKMTITVARVYPMLYHERTASGDSIVRNVKCEEKAQSKYEQQCWSKIEAFYANAEDFQGDDLSGKTAGMTIQLSEDYESLSTEEFVPKKQRDELMQELRLREEKFKQELQSKLRASLPAPRRVSTLLKVRVCDEDANAILAIWSPSEEVVDVLKEGGRVSLSNVVAAGKRGCELQLTARRSAIFKPARCNASYPARVCTPFCEITNSKFAPPYGEFDTVGFVCSVGPAPYGMKDFEVVHLAYSEADSNDPLYLSILFWQGIASFGYAEILTVGSIVACSNLEWRRATPWNIPAAYCTDRSTFTCNPRQNYLYEPFENLRNLITEPAKYVERCTSKLNAELQKKPTPTRYAPGKNTPNKIYSSGSSVDRKAFSDYTSPLSRLGTSSSLSFTAANPSIQRRLKKLQYYGDAPELSPIVLRQSKNLSLDFKSPIRIPDAISTKDTPSTDELNNSSSSDAPQK
ncbi:Breast cancer type 2 susceptibility protein-like protein [Ooceraea biroi]|uniref:Breast cancer type 2 susceptibility protein-like protein n=1 Tax=Ooceraea biroi TaxID=2015173 RepID=A0A026W4Z4_OOCBI|nr:Breast cancer type 2 susceptibility protein-like protein [Ooceraea biroi]